jgi:hypothetical protein
VYLLRIYWKFCTSGGIFEHYFFFRSCAFYATKQQEEQGAAARALQFATVAPLRRCAVAPLRFIVQTAKRYNKPLCRCGLSAKRLNVAKGRKAVEV